MRSLALLSLVIAGLFFTACGSDEGDGMSTQADLDTDRTFVATSVPWREGQQPIDRVVVRIEDKQVRLTAGCNELSTYGTSIEGETLLSESFVKTDMGCPGPLQEQDGWLRELLGSEPHISIASDRFELRSKDAFLTAVSSPAVPR